MTLWMEVTQDEFELPVCVADSIQELAEAAGTTKRNIQYALSKRKRGITKHGRFVRVEIGGSRHERRKPGKRK